MIVATIAGRSGRVLHPALGAVLLSAALHAQTQQVQYSAPVPPTAVPWSQNVTLPAFDPSLGILRAVQIYSFGSVWGTLGLENTQPTGVSILHNVVGRVIVTTPTGGLFPALNPAHEIYSINLGPYDGVTDYAGLSGMTHSFGPEYGTGVPSYTWHVFAPGLLPPYIATSPGQTLAIGLDASDWTSLGQLPPGVLEQHTLQVAASVTVTYSYSPLPTWFCSAAAGLPCPCGFSLDGCANSVSSSGGFLDFGGQASLSTDTLVLTGSGMPDSTALYFQGTEVSYAGLAFGDGVRCVAGTIQRLGAKANVGGSSQYPQAGDLPISVKGMVTAPGTTRYYQTQYRDAASFCTSATFNATSAVAILWAP